MPAKNPTRELFEREGLRFGPYANFRTRYELADMFTQAPVRDADWDFADDPVTLAVYQIYARANPNWAITGAGPVLAADQVLNVDGGVLFETDNTDNDQCIVFPRGDINSIVSTAWRVMTLEPQHEARFQAIIEIPAITNITLQFGLGLLANLELGGATQTDDDQAKIQFSTEGAVSTVNWTAMESVGGTDTETLLTGNAVAATKTYNLEVQYGSTRIARFYIDGVLKHTAAAAHTAAALLHPVFGIQALATGAKSCIVRGIRISRVWQDS